MQYPFLEFDNWYYHYFQNIFDYLKVDNDSKYLYFLSSVSQTLAAIFAFVFTFTLILAQLISKYSQRVITSIVNKYSIFYFVIFVISILFPLLIINKPFLLGIKITVITSSFSILFLIPYFLCFIERLNPAFLVEELQAKAISDLSRNPKSESENIKILENFILGAYSIRDYETFDKGLNALSNIIDLYSSNKLTLDEDNAKELIWKFKNILIITIKDDIALYKVSNQLNKISRKSIDEHNNCAVSYRTLKVFGSIINVAVLNKNWTFLRHLSNTIQTLVNHALKKGDYNTFYRGIRFITNIAEYAIKNYEEEVAVDSTRHLINFIDYAKEENVKKGVSIVDISKIEVELQVILGLNKSSAGVFESFNIIRDYFNNK
jgi:hypothetical protein